MPPNRLETRGLEKTYGGFTVSLDIAVNEGETLVLAGPSGSGKTTALNLIAGLVAPNKGKVLIGGEDVSALPPWKRNISMVFQDLALFPHLDVGGNIAYGLFIRGVRRNERRRITSETLEMVRLPGFSSRRIHTLSGGERQRVAIARALAVSPGALLLDEPFSSLDLPLRKELRVGFLEIRARSDAPCVFVTHDREEAVMLGNRIALMDAGHIVESGAGRELFLSPETEFAARFLGGGHVLPCRIVSRNAGGAEVSTPLGSMTVPAPLMDGQALFIPHDAIAIESGSGGERPASRKTFRALCQGACFNGPSLIVKIMLPPWGDGAEGLAQEKNCAGQSLMEIAAGPRTKVPEPGSMVEFTVDQSLLKFVRAG